MGLSPFGQISGSLNNGGKFYTAKAISNMEIEMPGGPAGVSETLIISANATISSLNVLLTASIAASASCYTAAHALMGRINTDLTAPVTGTSGAGSMDAVRVLHLSSSYETARLAGL